MNSNPVGCGTLATARSSVPTVHPTHPPPLRFHCFLRRQQNPLTALGLVSVEADQMSTTHQWNQTHEPNKPTSSRPFSPSTTS